ncbi:MAG: homocysteine S-methyltransferase family protein [Geminicoccaceae bacterium]
MTSGPMGELQKRLDAGGTLLLDGATGTELQRRGVPMDRAAWCAVATLTHGDVLRQVHEDYVRLGADIVTANTFASARHMMAHAGVGERTVEAYRRAVEVAREARDRAGGGRPVAVAGSISTMRPNVPGTDRRDASLELTPEQAAPNYREAAETMAEAGADLLLLEMIGDLKHGLAAFDAAKGTSLPVWVGLTLRQDADGRIRSFHDDGPPLDELVDAYRDRGAGAIGIMHTSMPDTDAALPVVAARAGVPVMTYPEVGYFTMPDWQFVDLDPATFADACLRWVAGGSRVVGGCCGLGPAHIEALAHRLGR